MSNFKEVVHNEVRIYIHNDLANAAFYAKENVLRIQRSQEAGISLHIMSALTMYAFAFEAKINFLGDKLIPNWKERESFNKKKNKVFEACKLGYENNTRPLVTINELKDFRDLIAHGKPFENSEEFERVVNRDNDEELELRISSPHEQYCTVDFLLNVADDIEQIWTDALGSSGIALCETVTRFSGGRTYIGEISEK
jgi:hypothetical protein